MPTAITESFTHDHHRCDHLLAAAEKAFSDGDWGVIDTAARALIEAMLLHFKIEEETLFPELAEVFRVAANPIEVMCSEHAQMRMLLEDLRAAVDARDADSARGALETLHFVGQQHNYKEETVLYPMADGALRERGQEIATLLPED